MKPNLLPSLQTRLSMTFSLRQALSMLELPQAELASWLIAEIEKNPLLELDSFAPSFPLNDDSRLEAQPTLYNHLMSQIRERFPLSDQPQAIILLEQLDERGYISTESPLLPTLQSFDPPGIFARDLRECLLLQLDPTSSAYKIVSLCFKELLHGKFEAIRKKTGISDLAPAIRSLSRLQLRPADSFRQVLTHPVIADLSISKLGKTWIVESKDEELPKFHLRTDYLSLNPEFPPEKEILRAWSSSGKWLLRSLKRRKSILLDIGVFLVKKQAAYLHGQGALQPLSMQELAQHVHLHESTLSRALSGKYASTPRGLLLLRSLVSASSESAKLALQKLIAQEDKTKPLSDEEIVTRLRETGTVVARRTVAKYRSQLKIGPASRRKHTKR